MNHSKDLPLSFPVGKNSGSGGKAEAMEEFWLRYSGQNPELIVIDPKQEVELLGSLERDSQSSCFSPIHSCPVTDPDKDD